MHRAQKYTAARIAMGFHRDRRLEPDALARHSAYADREALFLVEAIAGLVAADETPDERARLVRQRQMSRLGVSRGAARGPGMPAPSRQRSAWPQVLPAGS